MIPDLTAAGVLPPSIHDADDWSEVVRRFGGTPERTALLAKLRRGLDNLRDAGCPWVLLDGSFVTNKPNPNDVDGCWEMSASMDLARLDVSFFLQSWSDRELLKARYGTDFFRANQIEAASGKPFPTFFQEDRNNEPRGIVRLKLAGENGREESRAGSGDSIDARE
jgi:hypothetical protein